MGYSVRYGGGFLDYPTTSTPIDSAFLNAVEAALLRVDVGSPSTNYVPVWDGTKFTAQQITNSQISASAAIAKSKLDFGSGLTNSDIATAAAIAYSKLNLAASIVNADVSASAAIAYSKLSGVEATITRYRKVTSKTVNTSTTPTDLFNGEITVGAGAMGTTGVLRGSAHGDWKQNSGGTANAPRFVLALGGTTLIDTNVITGAHPDLATRYGWEIEFKIANLTASTQSVYFSLRGAAGDLVAAGVAFATGEGHYATLRSSNGNQLVANGWNSGAKDTTGALALTLTVTNASANANYETKLYAAHMEIV